MAICPKCKEEMKRFNVRFVEKKFLDRTLFDESKEKVEEYMKNKYPRRAILSIEEY